MANKQNVNPLKAHFNKVKLTLESPPQPTAVTEATGEAAAAMCILEGTTTIYNVLTTAGFEMEWGMHVHSGTGIDQIWSRTQPSKQYLIVEATGPNAVASPGNGSPPSLYQMSTHWVIHNLEIMRRKKHQIAIDILNDLKLNIIVRWPAYNGSSKNYYGVNTAAPTSNQRFRTLRRSYQAQWQPDGMLGYSPTYFKQYQNLTK